MNDAKYYCTFRCWSKLCLEEKQKVRNLNSDYSLLPLLHTDTHVLTSHTGMLKIKSFKVFFEDFSRNFTKNESLHRYFLYIFQETLYKMNPANITIRNASPMSLFVPLLLDILLASPVWHTFWIGPDENVFWQHRIQFKNISFKNMSSCWKMGKISMFWKTYHLWRKSNYEHITTRK